VFSVDNIWKSKCCQMTKRDSFKEVRSKIIAEFPLPVPKPYEPCPHP